MAGKTLVELGAGKGGGIKYLIEELKPIKAIAVEESALLANFIKANTTD